MIKDSVEIASTAQTVPNAIFGTWTSKEIIATIISVIATIATIYFAIKQRSLNKRLEKFESDKGELQLLSITVRYFISFYNSFSKQKNDGLTIKNDDITKNQYIAECKSIIDDLNKLINNHFYIDLLEKYPEIIKYSVQLRREIVEQETSISKGESSFALNHDSLNNFSHLYYILKNKNNTMKIYEEEIIKEIELLLTTIHKNNPDIFK